MAFSGMTDPGGYFFIPLIPEGEPFTALAIDTANGDTRTFEGTGPAMGDSILMFFDFVNEDTSGATPIQIGEVVTGAITATGQVDLYGFPADTGQAVFFDGQTPGPSSIRWAASDRTGVELFSASVSANRGPFVLAQGGTHIITVKGSTTEITGTYQFQVWDVPDPDEFAISIGDTVSNGVPGPGAGNIETPAVKDIYTFSATAGQEVFFELLDRQGLVQTDWRLQDPSGDVIFQESMYTDNTGPYVLTSGGTYTLTVGLDEEWGETGTYQFKLWNVPAPDEFVISIGDTISDGVPGPGAGNIETPAVKDIYTFSATAGQEILLDLLDHQGLTQTDWRLQDPSGNAIFQSSMFNGDEGPYALTTSGTFTITVGLDAEWSETGTYQFQLQACPCP
jgi:hypothetical protein